MGILHAGQGGLLGLKEDDIFVCAKNKNKGAKVKNMINNFFIIAMTLPSFQRI
jgi:hypothetical protein